MEWDRIVTEVIDSHFGMERCEGDRTEAQTDGLRAFVTDRKVLGLKDMFWEGILDEDGI